MRVNELISKINTEGFDIAEALEVKIYLPIVLKKVIAQEIVYDCTSEDNGVTMVDSFERYMSYVRHMITEHTNLEYTDDDYDILCSTEYNGQSLLNAIMSCFGEDAKECSRILDMVTADYMQSTTLESIVARTLNGLENKVGDFLNIITDKTSAMMPDNLDISKLANFIENFEK